jgi:hypothetical protein
LVVLLRNVKRLFGVSPSFDRPLHFVCNEGYFSKVLGKFYLSMFLLLPHLLSLMARMRLHLL